MLLIHFTLQCKSRELTYHNNNHISGLSIFPFLITRTHRSRVPSSAHHHHHHFRLYSYYSLCKFTAVLFFCHTLLVLSMISLPQKVCKLTIREGLCTQVMFLLLIPQLHHVITRISPLPCKSVCTQCSQNSIQS